MFVDANILVQRVLRDYTLYADTFEIIDVRWSDGVLEEMTSNLAGKGLVRGETLPERQHNAERLRELMTEYYEYASVEVEQWAATTADSMEMDQKDRHVFAAALSAGADILLTENIKDFPTEKALETAGLDIRVMTFGDFLTEVLVPNQRAFKEVHRRTVEKLRGSDDTAVIRRLWSSLGSRHPNAVRAAADALGLAGALEVET